MSISSLPSRSRSHSRLYHKRSQFLPAKPREHVTLSSRLPLLAPLMVSLLLLTISSQATVAAAFPYASAHARWLQDVSAPPPPPIVAPPPPLATVSPPPPVAAASTASPPPLDSFSPPPPTTSPPPPTLSPPPPTTSPSPPLSPPPSPPSSPPPSPPLPPPPTPPSPPPSPPPTPPPPPSPPPPPPPLGTCPAPFTVGARCTNCTKAGGCICDSFGVCRPTCSYVPGVDYKSPTWRRACNTCPSKRLGVPNAQCACDINGSQQCVDFCALPENNNGVTPAKAGKDGCVCSPSKAKCVPFCNEKDGFKCSNSESGEGYCRAGLCYDICAIAKPGTVCRTCNRTKGGSCVCGSSGKCEPDLSCTGPSPVPLVLNSSNAYPCTSCSNAYYYPVTNVNVVTAPGCRCAGKGKCVEPCNGGLAEGAVCSGGAACADNTNGCRCTQGRCRPFCELPTNEGAACGDMFSQQGTCVGGKCVPRCSVAGSDGLQCSYNCTSQVCLCSAGQCKPQCQLPSAEGGECFDSAEEGHVLMRGEEGGSD
ncbi:unnamed protein product [Closterium sp. NIES-65]|nr:unnamed protein product [Closterium sp. NIES-65]